MASRYVCAQCGAPGVLDPGFTQMDSRYATGKCSGVHLGKQYLIRDDVIATEKKKPKKKESKRAADRQG